MSFTSFNTQGEPRVRRRDRLRSLAQATTLTIKKEINKYYEPSVTPPSRARSVMSTTSNEPIHNEMKRTDTDELEDMLEDALPEVVQPQCLIFPTYACQVDHHQQDIQWKIHLAGWAFAKPGSSRLDRWLLAAGRTYGGLARDTVEDTHFTSLLNQFRCETMKMTDVKLTLPGILAQRFIEQNEDLLRPDQQEKIREFRDYAASVNTGPSGRFEEEIYLDTASVKKLKEENKYLTVEATFAEDGEPPFNGYIDIIDPYGISVISDIDDTIKVTDILDGKDAILQNTFFRQAREVPHMSEVFQSWASEGAHVHYVSNSPWQVYPALSEFIASKHFPRGSMHLRSVSTQDLIIGKAGKHKREMIPKILRDFPHRKFILVGDSGEIDPEVFGDIYKEFPDQIIKIFIHDVTSQRAMNADKLAKDKPDSYYSSFRKFLSRDSRKSSSSQLAMDAMAQTEVPEEQAQLNDPEVPLLTKLEQFEARMKRVSRPMREGVFTVFTLASQLMLDPVVAEEFLMSKTTDMAI
ncbi:hypothetical protein INT47_010951 [Mucor saturninus]|uniref:Phosphatidate phosphatase APP1 catalytic domain-containing protein n=1 Tax=Mucor saturninus TaxID=64648 RepID=A0A8H7V737_9FUNG|nr:hypothetical protein INT47_010951 [Mucor saturninus]